MGVSVDLDNLVKSRFTLLIIYFIEAILQKFIEGHHLVLTKDYSSHLIIKVIPNPYNCHKLLDGSLHSRLPLLDHSVLYSSPDTGITGKGSDRL